MPTRSHIHRDDVFLHSSLRLSRQSRPEARHRRPKLPQAPGPSIRRWCGDSILTGATKQAHAKRPTASAPRAFGTQRTKSSRPTTRLKLAEPTRTASAKSARCRSMPTDMTNCSKAQPQSTCATPVRHRSTPSSSFLRSDATRLQHSRVSGIEPRRGSVLFSRSLPSCHRRRQAQRR